MKPLNNRVVTVSNKVQFDTYIRRSSMELSTRYFKHDVYDVTELLKLTDNRTPYTQPMSPIV